MAGGHGGGGTPGPIPNPEVKPPSADGTAGQPVGEQGAAGHEGALSFLLLGTMPEGPGFRPGPSFLFSE